MAKAAWTKEPKHLSLRSARKPQGGSYLSGVVVVTTKDREHGYTYVRFSLDAEEKIGKYMPRGIGAGSSAFLKIVWSGQQYEVRCCYVDSHGEALLWRCDELPSWCSFRPM